MSEISQKSKPEELSGEWRQGCEFYSSDPHSPATVRLRFRALAPLR